MELLTYIAYGAASITVAGFLFAIVRKTISSYKFIINKLSELESALKIRQQFRIIHDCMVVTESGKIIKVNKGETFRLYDIMKESPLVKGTIFHDEVTIYIDKNKLYILE